MTLRFRAADADVPVAVISRLRQLAQLSISDIRSRASAGAPLFEITPFDNDWEQQRTVLVDIAGEIASGSLPLVVSEVGDDEESPVSPEMLANLIQHYRDIELQTDRDSDLEQGYIDRPDEFEPHDEDWTR